MNSTIGAVTMAATLSFAAAGAAQAAVIYSQSGTAESSYFDSPQYASPGVEYLKPGTYRLRITTDLPAHLLIRTYYTARWDAYVAPQSPSSHWVEALETEEEGRTSAFGTSLVYDFVIPRPWVTYFDATYDPDYGIPLGTPMYRVHRYARPYLSLDAYTANGEGPEGYLINYAFTITAVPEPATWALLISGFALTGVALRRRHHPSPVTIA
jgi:hypothetical protein